MNAKHFFVGAAAALLAGATLNGSEAIGATLAAKGKCALLLDRSYNDQCSIVIKKNAITLLPKSSSSIRILPQSVSYFSMADKTTLKVDETLSLYENIRPWWLGGVPKWVKNAMSEKQNRHQVVIGYLNTDFEPSIALFEIEDKGKASGIFAEIAKVTGLRTGEYRKPDQIINPKLKLSLIRDTKKQAQRISGLCNMRMFDDAEPILEGLETYVYNRSNEISIFRSSEGTIMQMNQISLDIRNQCEQEFKRELAEIDAARRARLEAMRRKQAQQRAALAAKRARLAETERLKRRECFDMLASF
jgi:hypothetical protein